ncbi:MAG: 50S ribosomal protein L22 [Candidatus Brocadiae bacterium]|nr:50S ribosomal protein L22 [Candidatus Brocadiia bacterium]
MKFYAIHKYARITPRKARYVVDMIRNKTANEALEILATVPKRASYFVKKVLNSAVANAAQQEGIKLGNLFVREAKVHGGPTLKRYRPGPMGRAMGILKHTSHIEITLVEKAPEVEKPKDKAAKAKKDQKAETKKDKRGE